MWIFVAVVFFRCWYCYDDTQIDVVAIVDVNCCCCCFHDNSVNFVTLSILMLPFLSFFSNSILTKNLTLNYFIRVTSQHIEIGDFFHEIFFVPKRQFETFLHPWVNFINVLWAAITCTDPKSVKRQPSCQTLLRFWDLQVQKQLVERWWNWLHVA